MKGNVVHAKAVSKFDADDESTRPAFLIVDDLPANLGVLLDFFDTAGYQALLAESDAGALLYIGVSAAGYHPSGRSDARRHGWFRHLRTAES